MKLTHFRSVALELQRQLGLPISKAYLRLHTAVFLWGFTAILGRLISIEELPLVLWRVFLTSLSLLFFRAVRRELAGFSLKKALPFMAIGCVVALHWVCFFGSVKYSNVSITLVCAATASFMTSFLEPLLTGRKFRPYEAGLGVAVIPAMLLIAQSSGKYDTGVVLGLISAFLAALFTTLNKKFMGEGNSQYITFIELSSGTVLLALLAPLYLTLFPQATFLIDQRDGLLLVLLALAGTTIPFVLALEALRELSAFAATLTVNLEPIYGILLAVIIFQEHEELHSGFWVGAAIILGAVFLQPIIRWYRRKKAQRRSIKQKAQP